MKTILTVATVGTVDVVGQVGLEEEEDDRAASRERGSSFGPEIDEGKPRIPERTPEAEKAQRKA